MFIIASAFGGKMKKVALVIDNSASLDDQDLAYLKPAATVPISFIVNEKEYYENVNMSYAEFFDYLADKKTNVSTSQPSIETVKDEWRKVLKDYDELVHIVLSSGLSETCNSAINTSHSEEFEGRVFVPNNQHVAFTNKMSMYEARCMIDEGKSAKEIKEFLEKTRQDNGIYIAVDTLKYLKKGGRVTPAAAAIGTLLNIKPILQIHNGKLDAFQKVMSMRQARQKMLLAVRKEVEERFPEELKQGKIYCAVAHSYADVNAKEITDFSEEVKAAFPEMKFFDCQPLPLFIVAHTGPGALATGFVIDHMGAIEKSKISK